LPLLLQQVLRLSQPRLSGSAVGLAVLKKTITYVDFNGDETSEDHFFHLSKAELVELEMSHTGGLSASLEKIVEAEDGKSIIAEFKNIILSSYGVKSDNGKRFIKNQELRDDFASSEAYSTLFMELVTNADAAAEFIRGVIPQDMAEETAKLVAADTVVPFPVQKEVKVVEVVDEVPAVKTVTRAELQTMTPEALRNMQVKITTGEVTLIN
jgi:hypothetical protein